jgi:hypothetical protein
MSEAATVENLQNVVDYANRHGGRWDTEHEASVAEEWLETLKSKGETVSETLKSSVATVAAATRTHCSSK